MPTKCHCLAVRPFVWKLFIYIPYGCLQSSSRVLLRLLLSITVVIMAAFIISQTLFPMFYIVELIPLHISPLGMVGGK